MSLKVMGRIHPTQSMSYRRVPFHRDCRTICNWSKRSKIQLPHLTTHISMTKEHANNALPISASLHHLPLG